MKKAVILNFPYKSKEYSHEEIQNFNRWMAFFADQAHACQVYITLPMERGADPIPLNRNASANILTITVPSFDTCDRWRAGLLEALKDDGIRYFYLWAADFECSGEAKTSAALLLDHASEKDLLVGTIQASGFKEQIDTSGTFPLLHLWFPDEVSALEKRHITRPRSELLRLSRNLLERSLDKRWYPSEQTLHLLLLCIWGAEGFSFEAVHLSGLKDNELFRDAKEAFQQIERMELWIKYMWKDNKAAWSPDAYGKLSAKSFETLNLAFHVMFPGRKTRCPVSEENYRLVVQDSWNDIHHSRKQDWTALGAILVGQFGMYKLMEIVSKNIGNLSNTPKIYLIACVAGGALSLAGLFVSRRHKSLSDIKMEWINKAENRLGLIESPENPNGVIKVKDYAGISVNTLITWLYLILIIMNVVVAGYLIFQN